MELRPGLTLVPVCLLAISGALAQDPEPHFYSKEKEAALGRFLSRELEGSFGLEDDTAVVELIEDIAGRVAQPGETNTTPTVRVLKNQEPLVHPLPGGYLVVRSGLVAGVETEAELAAVLAHSIGHIVSRHGARSVSGVIDKASIPVVFLGGWSGACSRVSGVRFPLAWVKVAAEFEEEADLLAMKYLDLAGYDPSALADAFDRVSAATAPENSLMTAAVRDKAAALSSSGREYVTNSSRFVEVREKLMRQFAQQLQSQAPTLLEPNDP